MKILSKPSILYHWRAKAFVYLLQSLALASGAIVLLIVGFLLRESLPILRQVGMVRFFSDRTWHPTSGEFGLYPMLWGSMLVTIGGVAIATPLGLSSAIFCQYYAPPMVAQAYRRLIELLAGIPSVIYGLWGLVVLVPLISRLHPPGTSLLTGLLVLALMILPTIALVADTSLANVPPSYLQGAAALGLGRWAIVRSVAIPAARAGLSTAVVLGTGRAIGETMAVLMVCGNVVQMPEGLFSPVRTLTANMALEMAYAMADHRSALFVSGLVLMALVGLLVAIAEGINGEVYD
ncbi:MAG: phosphate ABC transporter permease subunit PstC [Alkalinema sp. RU_4_3]|nr:phosphate ABC transporter permease subunit PstC [Alkalinema sp. RU_4_3]